MDRVHNLGLTRRRMLGIGAGMLGSVGLLAACGQVAEPVDEAPEMEEKKAEAEAPTMETIEVEFWSLNGFWASFTEGVGLELRDEFNSMQDAIHIKTLPTPWGETFEKMPAAVAANAAPDMSFAPRFTIKTLAHAGLASEMTDMVKASSTIDNSDMWQEILDDAVWQGRQFGMPFTPDARTLFIGHENMIEGGLDPENPPATWDDLYTAIGRLVKKDGAKIAQLGYVPHWGPGSIWASWMVPLWQMGGSVISADDSTSTLDNETTVNVFDHVVRIYDLQDGYEAAEEFRGDADPRIVFTDRGASMIYTIFDTPHQPAYKPGFDKLVHSATPSPLPPGGTNATYSGCGDNIIPNGAKNAEAAFTFIEWLFEAPQDLRHALGKSRIPMRKSVANSDAYIQDDPLRREAVTSMEVAGFVVGAPGGIGILGLHNQLAQTIYKKEKTIQEALKETDQLVQAVLDETLANSVLE
jgi:multiple sugar transport system substrate-binding protein